MALGATTSSVVLHVISDASKLVMHGLATGLLGSALLAKLMTPLLFGVSVTDVATFVAAPAALVIVALLASAGPAARAASVTPVIALRAE
jgi:putative ABC transport system permease protein